MKLILKRSIMILLMFFSFTIRALAEDTINIITKEKLINTINNGKFTEKIEGGLDNVSITAVSTDNGLKITIASGTETFEYNVLENVTNNTVKYEFDMGTVEGLDDFAKILVKSIVGSYLYDWIYESSDYAKLEYFDLLGENLNSESQTNSGVCDLENNGICLKYDETNNKMSFEYELSDKVALYVNKTIKERIDYLNSLKLILKTGNITDKSIGINLSIKDYNSEEQLSCSVYRSEKEDGEYKKISDDNFLCNMSDGLYVMDDKLNDNTTYYYKVIVKNATKYSDVVQVKTLKTAKTPEENKTDDIKNPNIKDLTDNTSTDDKKSDIKNPETGAFINYFLVIIVMGLAVLSILLIRRKNKFFRI